MCIHPTNGQLLEVHNNYLSMIKINYLKSDKTAQRDSSGTNLDLNPAMSGQNAPTQLSKVKKAAKRIEITLKIETEVRANALNRVKLFIFPISVY